MAKVWKARPVVTAAEERVLKLCRKQKMWGFLRRHQHLVIDEELQGALAALYAADGPGRPPVAPEVLAIAMLLQVAFGVADHEVPTLTAVDARWQVVLGCLGNEEPLFSQGTVFNFRERARENGLMRRLLEKTVDVARVTGGFDHKRLRAIIDSSPLLGAGRVEDTFNLLGRAIAELVAVAATEAKRDADELARDLEISVALGKSVKAVLDIDWRLPDARARALRDLIGQFDRIRAWLTAQFDASELSEPPLSECLSTVERIIAQDTEPTPPQPGKADDSSSPDIVQGVAKDRLISLSDRDMRHGRKSKSKVFTGYKRHIGADADIPGLIAAVYVLPANRPEHEAAGPILAKLDEHFDVVQAQIDRGYLAAEAIVALRERGVDVVSKPPQQPRTERFSKLEFAVDFEQRVVTCPRGSTAPMQDSGSAQFPAAVCQACDLRAKCITAANKRGRSVRLHPQESWYRQMASELAEPAGRAKRRERVIVEHDLARLGAIQGAKARYRGLHKNQAHTEVVAAVNNCYVIGRLIDKEAA
jgi:hypothetical protein